MSRVTTEEVRALTAEAQSRTRVLLAAAAVHCGIRPPAALVRFDLRGRAAGQVRFPRNGPAVIRYNLQLLAENGQDFLARTLPHEVAHVVARAAFGPRIRPHGVEWQRLVRRLGADPSRCHDYDTSRSVTRRLTRHLYRCGCREHALTSIRHNRILAGQVYICRSCGEVLRPARE